VYGGAIAASLLSGSDTVNAARDSKVNDLFAQGLDATDVRKALTAAGMPAEFTEGAVGAEANRLDQNRRKTDALAGYAVAAGRRREDGTMDVRDAAVNTMAMVEAGSETRFTEADRKQMMREITERYGPNPTAADVAEYTNDTYGVSAADVDTEAYAGRVNAHRQAGANADARILADQRAAEQAARQRAAQPTQATTPRGTTSFAGDGDFRIIRDWGINGAVRFFSDGAADNLQEKYNASEGVQKFDIAATREAVQTAGEIKQVWREAYNFTPREAGDSLAARVAVMGGTGVAYLFGTAEGVLNTAGVLLDKAGPAVLPRYALGPVYNFLGGLQDAEALQTGSNDGLWKTAGKAAVRGALSIAQGTVDFAWNPFTGVGKIAGAVKSLWTQEGKDSMDAFKERFSSQLESYEKHPNSVESQQFLGTMLGGGAAVAASILIPAGVSRLTRLLRGAEAVGGAQAAVVGDVVHANPILQTQKELSILTRQVAATVDLELTTGTSRYALRYQRAMATGNENFAKMVRGSAIDVEMRLAMENRYAAELGESVFVNRVIPGSGNRMRPDVYFPNLGGSRVIFDFGGPSKVLGINKYAGMADYLIPVLHSGF
jgi:hypothetical protein